MILALDIATQVGWAAGKPGETPIWGSRSFEGGSTGQVVGLFRAWLNQRCYDLHPTLVVMEAPYIPHAGAKVPMNAKTLRRLLGMCATAEAVAWELRIDCREATTLEVARFFIGTQRLPRGTKKQATIEMCHRYGWDVSNDNEADAVALWHLAEFTLAPKLAARRGEGPLFLPNAKRDSSLTPNGNPGRSDMETVERAGYPSEGNSRQRAAALPLPGRPRQETGENRVNARGAGGSPALKSERPGVGAGAFLSTTKGRRGDVGWQVFRVR